MTVEEKLVEIFDAGGDMRHVYRRWWRSPKGWADRGMLLDDIFAYLCGTHGTPERRVEVFPVAKRAMTRVVRPKEDETPSTDD
jgi:hypothetical protein